MSGEYVTIQMSVDEWRDLLVDLDAWQAELDGGIYDSTDELEPGSLALVQLLGWQGVTL